MKKTLTYSVFTDKGGRAVNEDALMVELQDGNGCFVLCDGLGGHGMGDAASQLVTEVFCQQFRTGQKLPGLMDQSFLAAQDILIAEQKKRNAQKKMKTTVTALMTDGKKAYIGHVGDSRVYVFHHDQVRCRTLDHSIPQMLVAGGEITEQQIRNHPDRNMLLQVMGVPWEEPMYETMKPIPLRKCQAFLLCSDGFWELIEETRMCALLQQARDPAQWLEQMAAEVRANGVGRNMDNFSAIAVWCS